MKRYCPLLLSAFFFFTNSIHAREIHLYIGTYTDGESKGIYHYLFNTETGELRFSDVTGEIKNPSFLKISPNRRFLYSVAEGDSYNGIRGGGVAAYQIGKAGKLRKINDALSLGAYPCHVTVSPDNKKIVASNYGGGSLAIYDVVENGGISPIRQLIQHEGAGADPKRQASPHAHSSKFDKNGNQLFAADLGKDQLLIYTYNEDSLLFYPDKQSFVKMEPGAGPRHFAFDRKQDFIYVINELNSTISVLQKTKKGIRKIQDISTLPVGFTGTSYCADIHLSPDGRFVYGSNRGHNSIGIFSRDLKSGMLTLLGTEPVRGDWPRNFSIAPGGNFLLVANQKSDNITVFRIDRKNGKLTYSDIEIQVPSPVCLEFLNHLRGSWPNPLNLFH
ncbi:MAG: lactonase family protein [Prolixibacteraceae bacterium]|nr:lactonase family protein [Prolixibacteraceae bacterium]